MANINKAKERFLSTIQGVDREEVMELIKSNHEGLDLYTFFVSYGAKNTGDVDIVEIKEYVHKLYADWYFLNRTNNANTRIYNLTHQSLYSPQNLSVKDCFELIASNKYSDIMPIKIQYLNKLEEKFFVQIDIDRLFAKKINADWEARLYLNMPADVILDFVKEFVDRAYLSDWSATCKFLSQDDRSDSVIIYTNFDNIEKVISEIEDILDDYKIKYADIGEVNPLLGKVNDKIGFGESPKGNKTYFYSRCEALSNITNKATVMALKDSFVENEKSVIFRNDGKSFTPSEYLGYLIEKNLRESIHKTLRKLEKENGDKKEIARLEMMLDNLAAEIDITSQVNELKKSLTRSGNFTPQIKGVEVANFDYVDKLFNLFNREEATRIIPNEQKRRLVSAQIFKPTQEVFGENTTEILQGYFKIALTDAIAEIIECGKQDINIITENTIIGNLKKKKIDRLGRVLKAIIDDDDSGKEYLNSCIYDYIRILSTGIMENVEIYIDSNAIKLDNNINEDILLSFPEITQNIQKLSITPEYINNILIDNGINMNNLCVNKDTKVMSLEREKDSQDANRFYYAPENAIEKSK